MLKMRREGGSLPSSHDDVFVSGRGKNKFQPLPLYLLHAKKSILPASGRVMEKDFRVERVGPCVVLTMDFGENRFNTNFLRALDKALDQAER